MLTKELLSYSVRLGVLKPKFLEADDDSLKAFLSELLEVFRQSMGSTEPEILESCQDIGLTEQHLFSAFFKLLLDECNFVTEENLKPRRWQYLLEAQNLRQERPFPSLSEFQEALGARFQESFLEISERIYGDLPECQTLTKSVQINPDELINLYNLAQIQGLLLNAKNIQLKFGNSSLAKRRTLIRNLKFHRLLFETKPCDDESNTILEISGPLTLLEKGASYGMQLANFFPHILSLNEWEVFAEVYLKSKTYQLKLSYRDGICHSVAKPAAYIPPEYSGILESWKTCDPDWDISLCDEVFSLGYGADAWPDFVLKNKAGQKIYLELFHRWHYREIPKRLRALEKNSVKNYLVGVSKNISQKDPIWSGISDSNWFRSFGFMFKDFPTAKMILRHLNSLNLLC